MLSLSQSRQEVPGMDSHQSMQEEQFRTANSNEKRSTARAEQYFLECFWAEVLGFTTEESSVAPGRLWRENPKPHGRPASAAARFRPRSSNKHSSPFLLVFLEPLVFAQPQLCSH